MLGHVGSIVCVELIRAWARQLAAASVAAVCVPLTLICALVVLAFTGGFAGLGSLGEILTGPPAQRATPAIELAPVAYSRPAGGVLRARLAVAVARAHVSVAGRARVAAPIRRATAPAHVGAVPVIPVANMPQPVTRMPAAPSPPAVSPPRSAVDRVVGLATSLTDSAPAPVEPLTGQTVQSLAGAVPPLAQVSVP
jgi:hypothetical protein